MLFVLICRIIETVVVILLLVINMTRKQQQIFIAEILHDLGLDEQLIEIMTSLNQEEIKNINQ